MGLDMWMTRRPRQEDDVAYWRKANAIHQWLVDNVQWGEDDCDEYEITKQQLLELRGICLQIKTNTKLIDSEELVHDENGNERYWQIMDEKSRELAESLLPTQVGFFFGSVDYDEWYLQQIDETIKQIDKILDETDFSTQKIMYKSSW